MAFPWAIARAVVRPPTSAGTFPAGQGHPSSAPSASASAAAARMRYLSAMSTWILRDAASGPGLRVAAKDLIDVAGLPTTAGSRAIAEQARPAAADARCLAGLGPR